jgi:hypothetical protein
MANDIVVDLDLDYLLGYKHGFDIIERDLNLALQIGIQNSANKIHKKLIANMAKYGVTKLVPFIKMSFDSSSLSIEVFEDTGKGGECNNVAAFIEYGTGIVGAGQPHPKFPWAYDVNDYGTDGWLYLDSNNKLHWTMGTKAKPYMYDTVEWIRSYGIFAREVNAALKKLGYTKNKGVGAR